MIYNFCATWESKGMNKHEEVKQTYIHGNLKMFTTEKKNINMFHYE
jgi:hypothetical protein